MRASYLNVHLPSASQVQKPKKEVEAYTIPEQKRLMQVCAESDNLGARVIILLIETGMRIGELLGLCWEDVLWERRALRIHRTMLFYDSARRRKLQEGAKSESSNRTIPLSSKAMSLLTKMYDEAKNTNGLIFVHPGNPPEPVGYNRIRAQVNELCRQAGVKSCGMHIFRHTFATNCYHKGSSVKVLSKFLGHASVAVTYNTYVHLYGDALEEMREIVM